MKNSTQTGDALDLGQRPGDILLFCRPKGTSVLISWLTASPYYHVAICADTYHVIEARPRGIVCRDLRSKEGGRTFKVIPAPSGSGTRALNWARGQLGEKYDGLGLLVIVLDRIFARLHINYHPPGNRFTCAEFVAKAFHESGVELFPGQKLCDLIPADYAELLPEAGKARQLELGKT